MVRFTDLTLFVLDGPFKLHFTLRFFSVLKNDLEVFSDVFTVKEGAPNHLTIEHQPLYQGSGLHFLTGPCLRVRDVMGHVIPIFNANVQAVVEADDAGMTQMTFLRGEVARRGIHKAPTLLAP